MRVFHGYQNRSPWMLLNSVVTVILRFIAEIGSFGANYVKLHGWSKTQFVCNENVAQRMFFGYIRTTVAIGLFSDIAEKECVKERYLHSKAKIRLVQPCAAISAIAAWALVFIECASKRDWNRSRNTSAIQHYSTLFSVGKNMYMTTSWDLLRYLETNRFHAVDLCINNYHTIATSFVTVRLQGAGVPVVSVHDRTVGYVHITGEWQRYADRKQTGLLIRICSKMKMHITPYLRLTMRS